MIKVHRLNGSEVTLNASLIETVEASPDTAIVLATGNRYLVQESVDEVVEKMVEYQRRIHAGSKPPNPTEGFVKEP